MKLFDNKERIDSNPANHLDNTYDFYDRSSLKQVNQIRNTLNQWFDHYPQSEKSELKTRFHSEFSAAFFELFLHELFLNQGFQLEPHPDVPNTTKKPDFLVKGNGLEFYLEAKESTDKSNAERSIENRINKLYDEINQTETHNFFFRINELKLKTSEQPSGKRVRLFLEKQLINFDPDIITEQLKTNGLDGTDSINYEDDNLKLVISLIPKSKDARGKDGMRPIGIYPFDSFMGGADESIKSAIKKKATRYGKPDKPYIICINATSEKGMDHHDMMNALFGSLQISFSTDPNNKDEKWTRAMDGAFLNTNGPRYTRVSGIFITHVNTANIHVANHWLIKHPFAAKELVMDEFKLQKIEVIDNKIQTIKGDSIKEILNIPEDWMNLEINTAHNNG